MKFSGNTKWCADKSPPMLLGPDGIPVGSSEQRQSVELNHFAAIENGRPETPADLVGHYNQSTLHTEFGRVPLGNCIDPITLQIKLAKIKKDKATTDLVPPCVVSIAPEEFSVDEDKI